MINECTIIGIKSPDVLLAKNRDRNYYPKIKIIHEIINNIEVCYLYDVDTDWSEGMNEFGIGIVNSTLQGEMDEKDKIKASSSGKFSNDGEKIRRALGYKNISDAIKSLISFTAFSSGKNSLSGKPTSLNGHTLIGDTSDIYSLEQISTRPPIINRITTGNIIRTNHGINHPEAGYQTGKDKLSSIVRSIAADTLVNSISDLDFKKLLSYMDNIDIGLPGYLSHHRTNYKLWTTSSMVLNLTKLEFGVKLYKGTKFLGIVNNLPEGYSSKINIKVYQEHGERQHHQMD